MRPIRSSRFQEDIGLNYNGPKIRLSRQLGIALTPKAARHLERRPYPPGQHGLRRASTRSKAGGYKLQLLEKQRLRAQYNISERQMLNYFQHASRSKTNTGEVLIQLLETRLDAVVYRSGFARSIYAARQYVRHGHVTVNGRRVTIASFRIQPGDEVAIRDGSRIIPCFAEAKDRALPSPVYLFRSVETMTSRLLTLPRREDVPVICDVAQVIEFYSR
jgi:small subunit ribosomal protein S4